jgi:aminoglycoside/choline kinase family phosphotransferase
MNVDTRKAELESWLAGALGQPPSRVAPASADASFRRYFRVWRDGQTWVAMDAPPGKEDLRPYLQVAGLLAATGVNVPRVLASDLERGFLLLTDLGNRQYLDALRAGGDADLLYRDALDALMRIQTGAGDAMSALPAYDAARLRQEMQLFPDWFLGRHLGIPPGSAESALLEEQFAVLVGAALEQPQVLVHRDYHSRNLMVCEDNPGVLDFQDACIGAATYDLVSLLKDCYIAWPRERVLGWLREYRQMAARAGMRFPGDERDFIRAFDLMGLQRHLKVLGIFCRLWYRDGKRAYLADLPLVLAYALEVTGAEPALAGLDRLLRERVVPAFSAAQAREGAAA